MDTFLDEEGISHEFSATYTPQQNAVVERKNRTLIEIARTMLDEYKMPKHFWAEAVETACHATNRLYLHKLLGKTAYELLASNKPQVGYFRVFGSKCYILDKHRRSKFAPKSHEGFLLGYGSNSHTYRVYNNFTRKVEETVDVKFDESNGSQVEQLPIDVGDKDPSEAIQDLSIGKVRPMEVKVSTSSIQVEASTSRQGEPRVDTEASTSGTHQDEENEEAHQDEHQQPPSTPRQKNDNVNNEEGQEEAQDEEDVPPRPKQKLSRVRARIAKDHPVEKMYNDIQTGRITRSKTLLANFCEHYSFISLIHNSLHIFSSPLIPLSLYHITHHTQWLSPSSCPLPLLVPTSSPLASSSTASGLRVSTRESSRLSTPPPRRSSPPSVRVPRRIST